MTAALALLRRYWLHLLGLAVCAYVVHAAYGWAYGNGYNAANVRAEQIIAEFATAEAKAQADAREAEQAQAQRQAAIADQYEQDKTDAQVAYDRDVAELRAGNRQLRDRWAGAATDAVSQASRSAAELDAAAADREASAARIVRAARDADAQIRGLQAVVRADRQ